MKREPKKQFGCRLPTATIKDIADLSTKHGCHKVDVIVLAVTTLKNLGEDEEGRNTGLSLIQRRQEVATLRERLAEVSGRLDEDMAEWIGECRNESA